MDVVYATTLPAAPHSQDQHDPIQKLKDSRDQGGNIGQSSGIEVHCSRRALLPRPESSQSHAASAWHAQMHLVPQAGWRAQTDAPAEKTPTPNQAKLQLL
jgi:hypothetical protein